MVTTQEQQKVTFTVEKMFILPDAGSLLAFADVVINDAVIVRGCRILNGKKGLFVTMPQEQGKDNKWYDQFIIKNPSDFDALSTLLISHFNANK